MTLVRAARLLTRFTVRPLAVSTGNKLFFEYFCFYGKIFMFLTRKSQFATWTPTDLALSLMVRMGAKLNALIPSAQLPQRKNTSHTNIIITTRFFESKFLIQNYL